MGLISAGDEHNRRGDDALAGLVIDFDYQTHRVRDVSRRCSDYGITLHEKKFVFAAAEIDYCGFRTWLRSE